MQQVRVTSPDEARAALQQILAGQLSPASIRVPERKASCPLCRTSAWAGSRHFPGEPPSYWLCKWCGWRFERGEDPAEGTLALPVYHDCPGGSGIVLTWMEYEAGDGYREKTWSCRCGAEPTIWESLRPIPRFGSDPRLIEPPGS